MRAKVLRERVVEVQEVVAGRETLETFHSKELNVTTVRPNLLKTTPSTGQVIPYVRRRDRVWVVSCLRIDTFGFYRVCDGLQRFSLFQ